MRTFKRYKFLLSGMKSQKGKCTWKLGVWKKHPKWFADTPSTSSEKNRRIRNKTFQGIADAMAEQYTNFIKTKPITNQ